MQDEVNQEESEKDEVDRTKKGADSTGEAMHVKKSSRMEQLLYLKRFPTMNQH